MKPASSKAKGRRFQQYVRDVLLKAFPSLTQDDVRSTSMGNQGEDIQLSQAARILIPYQIECKAKAKSQVHTLYEQATLHGKSEPLLIIKKDRDIPLAVVSLAHFIELMKGK